MNATLRSEMGLMSDEEVALLLGVSKHTLYLWRAKGTGPNYIKLGRSVFYRKEHVQEWIDRSVVILREPIVVEEIEGVA